MPWIGGPASVSFARIDRDGQEPLWAMVVDTATSRSVSYWVAADLERMLRRGLDAIGAVPDGLVLATLDDLRGLPPREGEGF